MTTRDDAQVVVDCYFYTFRISVSTLRTYAFSPRAVQNWERFPICSYMTRIPSVRVGLYDYI